jgi:uncharacterized membrane protein
VSLYDALLLLHIVAAIIWLGAGFVLTLLVLRAERAGDEESESRHHQDASALAPLLFIPASMATLVFGLLLVAEGSWSFEQLWVSLGLAGFLVSFGVGILYFKPEGERIDALVEEHGPEYGEVRSRIRRLNAVDRIEVTVLFLVVGDMVLKPTGDDIGILLAGAAILAGVAVLSFATAQRAAPAQARP